MGEVIELSTDKPQNCEDCKHIGFFQTDYCTAFEEPIWDTTYFAEDCSVFEARS